MQRIETQPVDDKRSAPFFWVTVSATKLIRSQYRRQREKGKCETIEKTVPLRHGDPGLSQVLAVYAALVEIANEARARRAIGGDSADFVTERTKVAAYGGCSSKTVDRVVGFLERLELLKVERRRRQGSQMNLPSAYVLTEPLDSESGGGDCESPGGGDCESPNYIRSKELPTKQPRARGKGKKSAEGSAVADEPVNTELAKAILTYFSESVERKFSASTYLPLILECVHARPEVGLDRYQALIDAETGADAWWRKKSNSCTPSIIFKSPERLENCLSAKQPKESYADYMSKWKRGILGRGEEFV